MNLVDYYVSYMDDIVPSYRDNLGLSVQWSSGGRIYFIVARNFEYDTDEKIANYLKIPVETYRGLLLKFNGELKTDGNKTEVNFRKREDAQAARDFVAFYCYIEHSLNGRWNK